MKAPQRNRPLRALAILLAAVPFAFALIRAFETGGRDLRYLWVALAALCGATVVLSVGRSYGSSRHAAVALSAMVFVTATFFAIVAAWLLGTVFGPAMLVVGTAFGFFVAAGSLFHILAQAKPI